MVTVRPVQSMLASEVAASHEVAGRTRVSAARCRVGLDPRVVGAIGILPPE
jgi:hypothetical protein